MRSSTRSWPAAEISSDLLTVAKVRVVDIVVLKLRPADGSRLLVEFKERCAQQLLGLASASFC